MWIELPALWIVVLNIVGIPAAHLLVSWWSTRLPAGWFDPGAGMYQSRAWERGGKFYEKFFVLRSWKDRLPDAAPWFQGFPKGKLQCTDPSYLNEFRVETCRGEFSHWVQMIVISGFVIWNPFPASLVIVVYGILSNLPCIITQRHTRLRLTRVVGKVSRG